MGICRVGFEDDVFFVLVIVVFVLSIFVFFLDFLSEKGSESFFFFGGDDV